MTAAASPFVRNPTADAIIVEDAEGPLHLRISAYSKARGFTTAVLTRDENPGFATGLALLKDPSGPLSLLTPDQAMALWGAGLIALPAECPPPFAPDAFTTSRDGYVAHGFTPLSNCISPAMIATLAAHYRGKIEAGALRRENLQTDRHIAHNDAAGRVIQRALLPAVERLVGCPIKASYTYAALYHGGTELPAHTDRPQCKYTLSLLIGHSPEPADGVSSWPVQVYTNPEAPPTDCHQSVGGGLLFRGQELRHGRPKLPADHSCSVLLLHYVDADFTGPLD